MDRVTEVCVLSSAEEKLQNTPVKRLQGGNPTTGLPSGRLVPRTGELGITFKLQCKDNRKANLTTNYVILVFFLLSNSPASKFYAPTFRNTLYIILIKAQKTKKKSEILALIDSIKRQKYTKILTPLFYLGSE